MSNSIIQKNTVYFNTRPLFKAIKKFYFSKFSIILAKKGEGGGVKPIIEISIIFFIF